MECIISTIVLFRSTTGRPVGRPLILRFVRKNSAPRSARNQSWFGEPRFKQKRRRCRWGGIPLCPGLQLLPERRRLPSGAAPRSRPDLALPGSGGTIRVPLVAPRRAGHRCCGAPYSDGDLCRQATESLQWGRQDCFNRW